MAEEEVAPPRPPKFDLEKNDAEQKILASKFNLTTSSKGALRAIAIIRELVDIPKQDLSMKQKQHLWESYETVGRFQDAYELTGSEKHRILSEAKDEPCECPELVTHQLVNGQSVEVKYSNLFQRSRTFKDGKPAGVWVCNKCQHVFVKNDE